MRSFETKVGHIEVNTANAIHLPQGLIGITGSNNFCLAKSPSEKLSAFTVLQSLDYEDLTFLVLPIAINNTTYHKEGDLVDVCNYIGISIENAAALLVVASKYIDGVNCFVANVRAPIFIDTEHQTGAQFALVDDSYSTEHVL